MSGVVEGNALPEPETILSDEEWLEAKRLALSLLRADELDRPEAHLTYIKDRISAALARDVA